MNRWKEGEIYNKKTKPGEYIYRISRTHKQISTISQNDSCNRDGKANEQIKCMHITTEWVKSKKIKLNERTKEKNKNYATNGERK